MEWKKENLSMCTLPGQTTTIAPKKKVERTHPVSAAVYANFLVLTFFRGHFFFRVAADCDGK